MASRVLFKRNNNSGVVPAASALVQGELAMNTADGKVFLKKEDNTVLDITKTIFDKDTSVTTDESSGTPTITAKVNNDTKFYVDAAGTEFVKPVIIRDQQGLVFNDSVNEKTVTIKGPDNVDFSYEVKLPAFQPLDPSVLSLDGQGNLSWGSADGFGGNRVYVSDKRGSDTNDGVNAPVKTLTRAAQIAASVGLRPLDDPGDGKRNAKRLLEANRSFIQSQVIKWIEANFVNFTYDQAKCERDLGIIIDSVALDFTLGTNYKSVVAGRSYRRANAYTVIQDQILQTKYAILQAQQEGLSSITNPTALSRYNLAFGEIIDILENDVGDDSTDAIVYPTPGNASTEEVAAKDKLQANKTFLKEEVIAWINTNYSDFTYDAVKCARDTGFLLDAAGYDMVLNTNYNSVVAGRAYLRANSDYLQDNQKIQTVAAFNYARTQALLSVAGDATAVQRIDLAFGEILDILENGLVSGAGPTFSLGTDFTQTIIGDGDGTGYIRVESTTGAPNFSPAPISTEFYNFLSTLTAGTEFTVNTVVDGITYNTVVSFTQFAGGNPVDPNRNDLYYTFVSGDDLPFSYSATSLTLTFAGQVLDDSTDAIMFTEPSSATQDQIDAKNQLQVNKQFLADEVTAYINDQFVGYTYSGAVQTKCERDLGIIIDAAGYDAALGTNYNAVTAGLAYQRANSSYVLSDQNLQTIAGIEFAQALSLTAVAANATTATAVNAAFNEVLDIIKNGVVSTETAADALTFTIPTTASQATINANNQLTQNRAFIKAEIVAYVNANSPPAGYDSVKCARDVGFIVDALRYDLLYGGNSASIQSAQAYFVGAVGQLAAGQGDATIAAYEYLQTILSQIVRGLTVTPSAGNTTPQITGGGNATTSEGNLLGNLVQFTIDVITAGSTDGLPAPTQPSFTWVNANVVAARNALNSAKASIITQTSTYLFDTFDSFTYNSATCQRDVGYVVDALTYDILYGGNTATSTAAAAYWVGTTTQVNDQIYQTVKAYEHLLDIAQSVINRDVVITSTGFSGTAQDRTTYGQAGATEQARIATLLEIVTDVVRLGLNALPTPSYPNIAFADVGLRDARLELVADRQTIIDVTINFVKTTYQDFVYDSVRCARDVGYIVDGLTYDILYDGNSATVDTARSYWANAQTQVPGQQSVTAQAIDRLAYLVDKVVRGVTITDTYQTEVTQITSGSNATVTEANTLTSLVSIISTVVTDGLDSLPATVDPDTSWVAGAITANASAFRVTNRATIIANVIAFIADTFTGFEYDRATCSRDTGLILDAVILDFILGGNERSVEAGSAYYENGNTSAELVVNEQLFETAEANRHAKRIAKQIVQNQTVSPFFTPLGGEPVQIKYPSISGAAAVPQIETLFNTIIDIFSGNPIPTIVANRFQQVPVTISVSAGDFYIDNPIIIPDLCSVVGDSLRSVVIRPLNAGKDMFRIRNGAYMTGFTFRDGLDANLVPSYTFDWCVAFDDPDDPTVDRQGYFGLRRTKPQISLSPYIQNCSIISFLGGNGIWVDGAKIRDPNISPPGFNIEQENPVSGPTPPQGKSMVANAFTMVSFGGTGWLVTNDGYAQVVSCFQIFCLNGSYCQSGGYLSITNSATNFGVYALRSSGFSPSAFTFDRGFVAASGSSGGRVSLTTLGTEREPIAQYVLKFRNATTDADVTSNFKTASTEFSFDSTAFNAIGSGLPGNPARTGTITNIAGSGPYTATLTGVTTTGIVTGKYLTKTGGDGVLGSITTVTAVRAGANEIDITSNGAISAGALPLEFAVGGAINPVTDTLTIPDHGLLNGDSVYYYADYAISGNVPALGLIDNSIYFVRVVSANTIQLFNDNGLAFIANIQTGGVGTQRLAKNVEEFFVEKILNSHNVYQTLTLPEATPDYVFGVGTLITGTTGAFTNNAYVLSWTPATRELVVSNQLTTVGEEQQRIKFTALSTITADQSTYTGIPIVSVEDRSDLYTTEFTTNSTRTASQLLNPSGTIGFKCNFHRPSIVNSSSHTWEYAGSGTDYNALPQNGGTTILAYQQYTELPGRVYASGTNEIGDFLVGDFIKAENNTGKITFRTEVTVGQLNVLRLSLSSIEISSISNDTGLGDNEIGGASDTRLTTQKAIRSFINNRLGNVLDKNVSTNAVAGALVQLNSSGQINVDLIPPLRGVTTYATTTFGGRLTLSEKIPTVEVFNGDNASETYQQQTLTLTGGTLTAVVGDLITQNGTTGSGRVKEAVTGGTSVTLYGVTGTFSEDNAAQTIRKNGTTVTGVYPNALTAVAEIVDNYFLNNDTSSQFLILDGPGYSFTNGSTITSAVGLAQGQITEYREGVLYGLNRNSLVGGSLYTPASGAVTYTGVALTNVSGTGSGATADITVTNGAVTDVTIISGGSNYTTSTVLSASSATIGGTGSGFQIGANRADTRLYVDLVGDKTKFNASGAANDFFEDDNAPVVTISNLATFATFSFNANSDVNTTTSRITLTGHGLTNGDILQYSNQANTNIGGMTNNRAYFVKVINSSTIELYTNYALGAGDQLLLTGTSTGTHTLTRNTVAIGSTSLSFFYKAAHGFTVGDPVLVEGADLPAGLNSGTYYFVGSISTNTFTLHTIRANALASVGGATLSKVAVTDVGSGSATLTVQNVAFSATINNSSRSSANWGTVSVSSLDASNIVSGVFASSRLASAGTANTQTFLRGDSSWSYAVQGIRKNAGSSISLSGDSYTEGADTIYFNQPILDVDKVDGDSGTPNFTNIGVAAFDKAQFAVGKATNTPVDTGNVTIKPGVIDAGFLSGQAGTYYTNPDNLSKAVPVLKGGTGLTTYLEGDLLYAGSGGSLTQLPIGGVSTVLSSNGVIPSWTANLTLSGGVTSGNGVFNSNTNSTNTTSGALQVVGGAGITRNLFVGGDLSVTGAINFNSSLSITGDNAVITLSPGAAGTVSIQPAGITTIGTTGVQTTLVGNLSATGNQQNINFSPTGTNSAITINSAGTLTLSAAAAGGISVTSDITTANDIAVNGGDITTTATTFNLLNANATTVNFAGAATALTIGANASGTTTVRNNLTVTGDLTVSGTNATINATGVTIRDNAIQLANVVTPTNAVADGGGIILRGTTDHTILWDVTNTNWTLSEHVNIPTDKTFKVNNVAVLSATALGSSVVGSSLTSVGTLTGGTWTANVIAGQYGGTGVANTGRTITVAGNLTTTGAFSTTIAVTNVTSVTLPTSGTLIGTNDTGTVSNTMLAGAIPNSKLANSSITLNGSLVNLGDTITVTANLANNLTVGTGLQLDSGTTFNGGSARTISITSGVLTTTGTQTVTNKTFTDSSTLFQDDVDNSKKMAFQLSSIGTNTTRTLTVPNVDGTIITTGDTGSVTSTMLAGSIANAKLANSTISGVSLGSNLNSLTAGSFLTYSVGSTFNGSAASTLAVNATNANTGSTVVARDASGNFSAGTITAALTGLASSATNIRVSATDYVGNTASAANTVALRDGNQDIFANLFRGTATTARYADLAENYLGDVKYEAGTVVMFGGNAEVTLALDGTRRVAGVVSTNPAHLMNEGLQGETVIALALQGRVPCKVTGKIRKGDMLVAAGNGHARSEEDPKFGQVIGKALEDFDGDSGVIEVVVGRM